jgi:hypothetical protein
VRHLENADFEDSKHSGPSLTWCNTANVVCRCDGSSDTGLLVLVVYSLSGEVGSASLGALEDAIQMSALFIFSGEGSLHGRLGIAGSLKT